MCKKRQGLSLILLFVRLCFVLIVFMANSIFSNENQFNFVFSPGDAVEIRIFPDTGSFANGVYHIDDHGFVDFPILGMYNIIGKTFQEVEEMLKGIYISYLARPNIHVRPLIRATLIGGFYRPGLYWVDSRLGMWNLIQLAGGTTRDDGIKKLKWERNGDILASNLVPYLESGKSLRSIGFRSGDQIYVTNKERRVFWEIFTGDVLPLVTFTLSTIVSATTTYLTIQALNDNNP